MSKRLRQLVIPCTMSLTFIVSTSSYQAQAKELTGRVESIESGSHNLPAQSGSYNLPAGASSSFLQGGVRSDQALNPSLKLIPGQARGAFSGSAANGGGRFDADVVQYRGGARYAPGNPAPALRNLLPSSGNRIFGIIPPVSSYTLTPKTGVLEFGPSHGATQGTSRNGIATWAPGYNVTRGADANAENNGISHYSSDRHSSHQPPSSHGVTTWMPGYEVSQTVVPSGLSHGLPDASHAFVDRAPNMVKGITNWAPGYEVSNITSIAGADHSAGGLRAGYKGIISAYPGYEVKLSTSKHGIVCSAPGYEVALSLPGVVKSSLSGNWSANRAVPDALIASQGKLKEREIAQAICEPAPLTATALLLPGLDSAGKDANITWDEWYSRVARAIYSRWQYADVGPGTARVSITVDRQHNLSCQVVAFIPAPDVTRDVEEETAFKLAAFRAVNQISSFEIPRFPSSFENDKVTFEVDLKRIVDGPSGIDIGKAER